MKILSASQLREWESATMQRQGVSAADLMLRAATACADWFENAVSREQPIAVLCGTGLNGGDGLVLTRLLNERGYGVKAFFLKHSDSVAEATAQALHHLQAAATDLVEELAPGAHFTSIAPDVVIVDATLGLGTMRPLEGWLAGFVQGVSRLQNVKVALDMPTGAAADMLLGGPVMRVQHTLTFSSYKRTLLHPEIGGNAGAVHVLDIGLDADFLTDISTHHFTLEPADAAAIYRPREPFSHKGTYGTAFLIGGSKGLVGALGLATMAASRSGAGKVRALVPEVGYTTIQVLAPEAMCRTSGQDFLEDFDGWQTAKGIGIGPGLGTEQVTADALAAFLAECTQPIVLDADALTIIGERKELLSKIPTHSILTPHPKEFERLFGETSDTMHRAELARSEAMRYNLHIVLKDKHTMIATPGGACWYNLAGNAGLATGGSGDVLCGIITGLLSAGYGVCEAAMLGVYLHSTAGDFAASRTGMEALVAGDIVAHLGDAFRSLDTA
jgi:NAD(P)H-hydrate epimerase